jgi:hypothetical protein
MSRRLSAITSAHQLQNLPEPTRNARVIAVWEGIRRTQGAPPEQAAPLMPRCSSGSHRRTIGPRQRAEPAGRRRRTAGSRSPGQPSARTDVSASGVSTSFGWVAASVRISATVLRSVGGRRRSSSPRRKYHGSRVASTATGWYLRAACAPSVS